jgi:hypothetical protein
MRQQNFRGLLNSYCIAFPKTEKSDRLFSQKQQFRKLLQNSACREQPVGVWFSTGHRNDSTGLPVPGMMSGHFPMAFHFSVEEVDLWIVAA